MGSSPTRITKICSKCMEKKEIECFSFKNKATGKRHSICKACTCGHKRKYHLANRDRIRHDNREKRKEKRDFIQKLKSVPCKDCGQSFPYYVMDFDHTGKKNMLLSRCATNDVSITRIKEEAAKCDVVCSNCHRIRTHARL